MLFLPTAFSTAKRELTNPVRSLNVQPLLDGGQSFSGNPGFKREYWQHCSSSVCFAKQLERLQEMLRPQPTLITCWSHAGQKEVWADNMFRVARCSKLLKSSKKIHTSFPKIGNGQSGQRTPSIKSLCLTLRASRTPNKANEIKRAASCCSCRLQGLCFSQFLPGILVSIIQTLLGSAYKCVPA